MDNSAKSPIQLTKKTRKLNPADRRYKRNREPSQKQLDARIKPGQVLNPDGRPKTPQGLRTFRLDCEQILKEAGLPMLINHMYREGISTRDLLDIIKFLADRAYGKAKEVDPTEGQEAIESTKFISPIVISDELLEHARRNDSEHFAENDED